MLDCNALRETEIDFEMWNPMFDVIFATDVYLRAQQLYSGEFYSSRIKVSIRFLIYSINLISKFWFLISAYMSIHMSFINQYSLSRRGFGHLEKTLSVSWNTLSSNISKKKFITLQPSCFLTWMLKGNIIK